MFIFARFIKISKCAIRARYFADAKCVLQSVARKCFIGDGSSTTVLYLFGLLTV